MSANACPTEAMLKAFHCGELADSDLDPIVEHTESCAECSARLSELETKPNLLIDALRRTPEVEGSSSVSPAKAESWEASLPGYELLDRLGEGGMSVVYRARDLRLHRLVAVKFLRGATGPDVIERFRREAESVARLQHPNIVNVFEVGEHRASPYLTLELIEGGSLSEMLNGRPQLPRDAAGLVETLARAIDHAHLRGVVHRDLKPANVLLHDDAGPERPYGTPRLTDFGIAKLLDPDAAHTQTGVVMGTPAYMAPEQVTGTTIGPATDVYALGAILYEMLTGRPPFQAATTAETLRHVREIDPVSPRRLNPDVPRDLETVCLKCLAKEPDRRYASAVELADDLGRYRDGKSVVARPVSAATRTWMAVRRHPTVTGLIAACAALFVTGFVLVAWQWRVAVANERLAVINEGAAVRNFGEAEAQRKAALDNLDEARAVQQFLTDGLIGHANPTRTANARDLSVRELLDRASAELGDQFKDRPRVEATIRHTIGDAYNGLGEYAKAKPHLERALAIRTSEAGDTAPDTMATLTSLAQVETRSGRLDRAEELYKRVYQGFQITRGAEDPKTLAAGTQLAIFYVTWQSRLADAKPLFTHAVETLRRVQGPDHPQTLSAMREFAEYHQANKQYDEAEKLFNEAEDGYRRRGGDSDPNVLRLQIDLAELQLDQRRFDRAAPVFIATINELRTRYGETHADTLMCRNNLAAVWQGLGKMPEAREEYRQLVELCRAEFGETHPQTLTIRSNLASVNLATGHVVEAEKDFRFIWQARQVKPGPNDLYTLQTQLFLAKSCRLQQNVGEAESLLTDAIERYGKTYGENHPATWNAKRNAVDLYRQTQRRDKVEVILREQLAFERSKSPKSAALCHVLYELGEAILFQKRPVEAEPFLRESIAMNQDIKRGGWATHLTRSLLGESLMGQKKYDEATSHLTDAYKAMKAAEREIPADRRQRMLHAAALRVVRLHQATGNMAAATEWEQFANAHAERKK